MPKSLTARSIARLKPDVAAYYVTDAVRRGLQLRVGIDGAKTWSVRYRIGRRMRRLTLGSLKDLSLADARQRARDAMRAASAQVQSGRAEGRASSGADGWRLRRHVPRTAREAEAEALEGREVSPR